MDNAGVECATLVQPNGTYGLDNSYQCDSALRYAPRTVSVGILDPAASDAADKLSYWVNERDMKGVRLQSQAEPDDPRCDALWQRAEGLGSPSPSEAAASPTRSTGCAPSAPVIPNVLFAPDHFGRLERRGGQGGDDRRVGRTGRFTQCLPSHFQHQPGSPCRAERR